MEAAQSSLFIYIVQERLAYYRSSKTMISIYRGEDTQFAGAEPISVEIDTELDLTGCTAELYFGSIVKSFDSEQLNKKTLPLVFTAEETETFFPGKGYAIVKVKDSEGRVSVLKKFVIDVRMRDSAAPAPDRRDVAEAMASFEQIRDAAYGLSELTEKDGIEKVKEALNQVLSAAKKRGEYSEVPTLDGIGMMSASSAALFTDSVRSLTALATNIDSLTEESDMDDVRETVNRIVKILSAVQVDSIRDVDFSQIKSPSASVNSIKEWADKVGTVLRRVR